MIFRQVIRYRSIHRVKVRQAEVRRDTQKTLVQSYQKTPRSNNNPCKRFLLRCEGEISLTRSLFFGWKSITRQVSDFEFLRISSISSKIIANYWFFNNNRRLLKFQENFHGVVEGQARWKWLSKKIEGNRRKKRLRLFSFVFCFWYCLLAVSFNWTLFHSTLSLHQSRKLTQTWKTQTNIQKTIN